MFCSFISACSQSQSPLLSLYSLQRERSASQTAQQTYQISNVDKEREEDTYRWGKKTYACAKKNIDRVTDVSRRVRRGVRVRGIHGAHVQRNEYRKADLSERGEIYKRRYKYIYTSTCMCKEGADLSSVHFSALQKKKKSPSRLLWDLAHPFSRKSISAC